MPEIPRKEGPRVLLLTAECWLCNNEVRRYHLYRLSQYEFVCRDCEVGWKGPALDVRSVPQPDLNRDREDYAFQNSLNQEVYPRANWSRMPEYEIVHDVWVHHERVAMQVIRSETSIKVLNVS